MLTPAEIGPSGLDLTYKELKQFQRGRIPQPGDGLDLTYKELKLRLLKKLAIRIETV